MKIRSLFPLFLSLVVLVHICSYFWADTNRVFAEGLSGDTLMSSYYYQIFANSYESGFPVHKLEAFDHPSPHNIQNQFPSTFDAQLLSPIMALASWPSNWAYIHVFILCLCWVSWIFFGWSLGCRGWLLAALGVQGLLFRPMWTQFLLGRYNLVFSPVLLLSMAFLLSSQRKNIQGGENPRFIRFISYLLFVPVSLWGFLLYPPFALMLVPFGVYIVVCSTRINKNSHWRIAAIICIVITLIFPFVQSILSSQSSNIGQCDTSLCPVPATVLTWNRIQPIGQDISLPNLSVARENWWLIGVSLLFIRSWRHLFILLFPIGFIVFAMGPCPDIPIGKSHIESIWDTFPFLHCTITYVHDLSRLGMVGLLLIPFCFILCTKRNLITTFLFILITSHLLWRSQFEIGDSPYWWNTNGKNSIISHVEEYQPSVIVELPFDQSQQFVSAIHYPNIARINPWTLNAKPPLNDESLHFIFEVGYERSIKSTPTKEGFIGLGLNYIYFDKQRCRTSKACRDVPEKYMNPILGKPLVLDDGSFVWSIQ